MTAAQLDLKLWKILGTGNIRALRNTYDLAIIANNRERKARKPRKRKKRGVPRVRLVRRPSPKKNKHPLTITAFRALPIQQYG